jgi:acetylornithine deacetylase/succinyl-diaminopimelate desuccinylase-like protein
MSADEAAIQEDVVPLLQQMIRNACVNDGKGGGDEMRSVRTLQKFFVDSALEVQTFEPAPGRGSIATRIKGEDSDAPSLMLMGHLDVVPANAVDWDHDPFGGELVDGFVWGRGAIDMLNLTASMAVAVKRLASSGFQPKGDLIFLGVADEESGGDLGAGWLAYNHPQIARATYVLSEWGGVALDIPDSGDGIKHWITTGQKGGTTLRIMVRGASGHASMPYGSDNAIVKTARAIERIAALEATPQIIDSWRRQVEALEFDAEFTDRLLDPARLDDAINELPPGLAKRFHASVRTTYSPTIVHGGVKQNVIPDTVELTVLARRLETESLEDVLESIRTATAGVVDVADIEVKMEVPPTSSSIDTPLYETLERVSAKLMPGSRCVPAITAGGNDLGWFRDLGSIAYGFGLLTNKIRTEEFFSMFHGKNERVDVDSLVLSTKLWEAVARDLLG